MLLRVGFAAIVLGLLWRPHWRSFIYYDPQHDLDMTHQFPFATIVTKDYGNFDDPRIWIVRGCSSSTSA